MNRSMLMAVLIATLTFAACDKPTVVNVPAAPVAVPGPSGPPGATGDQGATGSQGATGTSTEGGAVIVTPPASSGPAN